VGNLLIRDVPEVLKGAISKAARRNHRSLSEQAKIMLTQSVSAQESVNPKAELSTFDLIRASFGEDRPTDELHDAYLRDLEYARKIAYERPVPELE
jgi:plasmid stability protein